MQAPDFDLEDLIQREGDAIEAALAAIDAQGEIIAAIVEALAYPPACPFCGRPYAAAEEWERAEAKKRHNE